MSDVVLVMFKGRIVGSFASDELDLDEIGLLMTGSGAEIASTDTPTATSTRAGS